MSRQQSNNGTVVSPPLSARTLLPFILGILSVLFTWYLLIVFLPYISSWGWNVQQQQHGPTNRNNQQQSKYLNSNCTCNCWDGKYKGVYGRSSPITGSEYQFIYFNMQKQTWHLFVIVALYLLMSHKMFEQMFRLLLNKQANYVSVLVLLTTIYPSWFNMWTHFHLINDQYQTMHHRGTIAYPLVFTLSDWFMCCVVVYLLDHRIVSHVKQVSASCLMVSHRSMWYLWLCLYMALTHVFYSVKNRDQVRMILGTGVFQHVRLRNSALLLSHLAICALMVIMLNVKYHLQNSMTWRSMMKRLAACMILSGFSAFILNRMVMHANEL